MSTSVPGRGTFVVLGAKGGTGRLIVAELLSRPAEVVRRVLACVRDPEDVPGGTFPDGDERLEIVKHEISVAGPGLPAEATESADAVHTVFFAAAGKGYETSKTVDNLSKTKRMPNVCLH